MSTLYNVTCVQVTETPVSPVQSDGSNFIPIHPKRDAPFNGGLWMAITAIWFNSKTKYVCYLPRGYGNVFGRFKAQTEFMERYDLAASYSDLAMVDDSGSENAMVTYKDFHPDMIGTPALPTESLLIDRQKFMDAGGFDNVMAGTVDPIRYLGTMAACSGRIMRIPKFLVNFTGHPITFMTSKKEIGFVDEDFQKINERFQMERWVNRARAYYRSMRW